jgi:hypothetical protein
MDKEYEMRSAATRRTGVPILIAAFLSLLLASQTVAAAWSQPIALTSSGKAAAGDLVTLGSSQVIAAYQNKGRIVVRRSTNSGVTWLSPVRLADNVDADHPAIAGKGTKVDVVWAKNDRVRYARSTNSGASFGTPVALSPKNRLVQGPTVARGPNGLVVVAWMQVTRLSDIGGDAPWNIHARVSTNGGASFRPARILGQGWQVVAAAGNGVAYVAFDGLRDRIVDNGMVSDPVIHVWRTLDGGASWKAPAHLRVETTLRGMWGISITAAGKHAYLAYTDTIDDDGATPLWIRYRRTTDKGKTWSAARDVTSPTGHDTFDPQISLKGGVVRAIYARGPWFAQTVYYAQSGNGLNWTSAAKVSPRVDEHPAGVGHATRIIVLYTGFDTAWHGGVRKSDVFVRTASP